jgi:hypothetical protein
VQKHRWCEGGPYSERSRSPTVPSTTGFTDPASPHYGICVFCYSKAAYILPRNGASIRATLTPHWYKTSGNPVRKSEALRSWAKPAAASCGTFCRTTLFLPIFQVEVSVYPKPSHHSPLRFSNSPQSQQNVFSAMSAPAYVSRPPQLSRPHPGAAPSRVSALPSAQPLPIQRKTKGVVAPSVYRPSLAQGLSLAIATQSGRERRQAGPPPYRPQMGLTQAKQAPTERSVQPDSRPLIGDPIAAPKNAIQRNRGSVIQKKCRYCGTEWCNGVNCRFRPTVGSQVGYAFTQAVVNNVPSNIGTFALGAMARSGGPRGRLLGGLLGLGANLAWGTSDNYYQNPEKTRLLWKPQEPHL